MIEIEEGFNFPEITHVEFKDNLILIADFEDGTRKEYDCHDLLQFSDHCKKLLDPDFFKQGRIGCYSIVWDEYVDVDMYGIWKFGKVVV